MGAADTAGFSSVEGKDQGLDFVYTCNLATIFQRVGFHSLLKCLFGIISEGKPSGLHVHVFPSINIIGLLN